jgi:hypothetical protein
MSCSNNIPNIDFSKCCEDIKNPFGEDVLNTFLISTSTSFNGTTTSIPI